MTFNVSNCNLNMDNSDSTAAQLAKALKENNRALQEIAKAARKNAEAIQHLLSGNDLRTIGMNFAPVNLGPADELIKPRQSWDSWRSDWEEEE